MCSRVTVVSLCVCVQILSVTVLSATYMIFESNLRYHRVLYGILQICNGWFLLNVVSRVPVMEAVDRLLNQTVRN